jgi:hypothetical protein
MFTSPFVVGIVFIKKIPEKKDLQYNKHNKKFNDDYNPDLSSPAGHISESIIIKMEKLVN